MDPKTLALWHSKFAALLERARTLDQSGEDAIDLAREFEDFTHAHPPAAELNEMDQLARDTHDALVSGDVTKRVAVIKANNDAFSALTEKIQAATGLNLKTAGSISLANLQLVVSTATDAVTAIKDLKAAIEQQNGAPGQLTVLADKLDSALAALGKFQSAVKPAE